MKSTRLTFLTLLLAFSSAMSQTSDHLLWEVSGNGLDKPSYIFGILKFIPADQYYMPETVVEKLDQAQILSIETTLDHHARHELNKAAHLDHHETLEDYLTESEYQQLNDIFSNELGISNFKFNLIYRHFKPVMLSTTMTRLSLGKNIKFYEFELMNFADANNLPVMALESVESEVAALSRISLEDQLASLRHTIDNFDEQLEEYDQLVKAYTSGDLKTTLEYTMHPAEIHDDYEDYYVFKRNANWVPKMINYMKEGSVFFAVGASHLPEDKGLLQLLKNEGYTVTPIK